MVSRRGVFGVLAGGLFGCGVVSMVKRYRPSLVGDCSSHCVDIWNDKCLGMKMHRREIVSPFSDLYSFRVSVTADGKLVVESYDVWYDSDGFHVNKRSDGELNTLTRVVDGDWVVRAFDGRGETVRLITKEDYLV